MDYFAVWFNVCMYAYVCMDVGVLLPGVSYVFVCLYIHKCNQNNDIIRNKLDRLNRLNK